MTQFVGVLSIERCYTELETIGGCKDSTLPCIHTDPELSCHIFILQPEDSGDPAVPVLLVINTRHHIFASSLLSG